MAHSCLNVVGSHCSDWIMTPYNWYYYCYYYHYYLFWPWQIYSHAHTKINIIHNLVQIISPCSQRLARCHVTRQHCSIAPAPKLSAELKASLAVITWLGTDLYTQVVELLCLPIILYQQMSEWVEFNAPLDTIQVISEAEIYQQISKPIVYNKTDLPQIEQWWARSGLIALHTLQYRISN